MDRLNPSCLAIVAVLVVLLTAGAVRLAVAWAGFLEDIRTQLHRDEDH